MLAPVYGLGVVSFSVAVLVLVYVAVVVEVSFLVAFF